jgi:uncharacterized protein (DUF58 family)
LATIILFNLIIALKTSVEFFYFFFWFLMTVVCISLAWVAAQYFGARLYLERNLAGKIEEDDILEVTAKIKSKSFLPVFNALVIDYLPCAAERQQEKKILLDYLGPKSHTNIIYTCLCFKRGKYNLGPFLVYFFDPFGLFFLKKTYSVYSELYVYPKTFMIQKLPTLTKGMLPWFGIETGRVSGDEHEFYGIREYKPGDPVKKIHWLTTARKNTLIIKQFQQLVFFRATIIFNLEKERNYGEGKECVAEYMIKIAASLAKHLIERNVSLQLIAHTQEMVHMPFNKGPEHLEDIFRFLSLAQAESRVGFGEIFEEFSNYILHDSSLIVIMLDKDWESLPRILSLEKRNISFIPLVLLSSTFLDHNQKQKDIKNLNMDLPQVFDIKPVFFSCGDNLEEIFKY